MNVCLLTHVRMNEVNEPFMVKVHENVEAKIMAPDGAKQCEEAEQRNVCGWIIYTRLFGMSCANAALSDWNARTKSMRTASAISSRFLLLSNRGSKWGRFCAK